MEDSDYTSARKLDHIRAVLDRDVESKEHSLLEYVRLVHNSIPGIDLEDVDLGTKFCGKELSAPLMITGMTGGHPDTLLINEKLAQIAEKYGIAMGVGSQRAGIENERVANTFTIARKTAPTAFLVANIGAPQLSRNYNVKEIQKAVEMIDADAVAIHLNPAQEAYQLEGEPYYRNILEKISEIIDEINVPLIVKETGNGLSKEVVNELRKIGVKCFDVSGLGGTNWIKVEVVRATLRGEKPLPAGPLADYWGNPTGIAIIEARDAAPDAYIVGSGGIRNGLDAAKAIALGSDIAGIALPVLRALMLKGFDTASDFINSIIYQLKTIIYLTGGHTTTDLWRAPLTIYGRLYEELERRRINVSQYLYVKRLAPLRVRRW